MRRLREHLRRLADERATGTLHLDGQGALYLADGAVVHAESRHTPSLRDLLVNSGRLSEHGWECLRAGGASAALAVPGRLSRAELQMYQLIALFDAVYFLAPCRAEPRFTAGERHWLAGFTAADPATLAHEVRRRRALLGAAWPSPLADDAPLEPVRRLHRQRVVLTGLQAELLLNADGRKTPSELARELGRTRFGCTLAVRGLVASALARAPEPEEGVRMPRRHPGGAPRRALPVTSGAPSRPRWAEADPGLLALLQDALRELE
ncbi:hypothetical protein [Actinocorallia populi]|uniref:hypothetical protein n=1 Tax=Actinocorallia populi TaxID=2079200 RepID=UPI000D089DC0|nr:hypothetical protein [Actinocorallia populi]